MTDNRSLGSLGRNEFLVRPEGRYEKYEKGVKRLALAIKFVKRHRVIFSVSAALTLVCVITLMICSGIFMGEASCSDFKYGEEPTLQVKAFLARVRYEYASPDSPGDWSGDIPVIPGEYLIRAMTVNPFGMKRYTEVFSFNLLARPLSVSVESKGCIYGNLNDAFLKNSTKTVGLAENDTLKNVKYKIEERNSKTLRVSVESFEIVDAKGRNVSSIYDVTLGAGLIAIHQREITVGAKDVRHTYDGKYVDAGKLALIKGTLAPADKMEEWIGDSYVDAGVYPVSVDRLKITNSDGEDVTEYYKISVQSGTVIISPARLSFTTSSAKKTFDASSLSSSEWKLTEGKVAEGHRIVAKTAGEIFYAGVCTNELELDILDEKGKSVLDNYSVSVDKGTLEILPIPLYYTTDSAEKVYDGSALTAKGFGMTGGELLPGHSIIACETVGKQTNAGKSFNGLKAVIENASGEDMTDGYELIVEKGVLEVKPRPLTLTSDSAEKPYDSKPLYCHEWSLASGDFAETDINHEADFSGEQTDVGQSPNTFSLTIYDRGNSNRTANYSITYVFGTLTVTPSDYVPPENDNNSSSGNNGSSSGNNNNNPGSSSGDDLAGSIVNGGIGYPDDIRKVTMARIRITGMSNRMYRTYLRASSFGDYNGSGFESAGEFTYPSGASAIDLVASAAKKNGALPDIMEIELLEDCPALIPYYIDSYSQLFGSLENSPVPPESKYSLPFYYLPGLGDISALDGHQADAFEMAYREYVYDTYLQIPASTRDALLTIAKQEGLTDEREIFALIAAVQSYIQSAGTYNLGGTDYPQGVDVAVYFLTQAREGICQHFAASATMMYRALGIPARYTVGFVKDLPAGMRAEVSALDAHAWVEVYIDGIGWIPVEVTGSGYEQESSKINLAIMAYSGSKEYDGTRFGEWKGDMFNIISGYLLPGHTLSATVEETGRNFSAPGSYLNKITSYAVYDSSGNDVTEEFYNITALDGTMTIRKRSLVIQTGSASKTDDGESLSCNEWWIISGSLLPDHTLIVKTEESLIGQGSIENTATVYVDKTLPSGSIEAVEKFYDITVIPGILEILPE